MGYYRNLAIETHSNLEEPSNKSIRVRPLAGQGLSPSLNVECSANMRERNPVGSIFIVRAKITDRQGTSFIYSYHGWAYQKVTRDEAERFIRKHAQEV